MVMIQLVIAELGFEASDFSSISLSTTPQCQERQGVEFREKSSHLTINCVFHKLKKPKSQDLSSRLS